MNEDIRVFEKPVYSLAILSALFTLLNLVLIPLFKKEILIQQDIMSTVELVLLIGFFFIFAFNILSPIWLMLQYNRLSKYRTFAIFLIILGFFCLVMLLVEKVMIDEIARETRLGWETLGEWIILDSLFFIQLIYSFAMILFIRTQSAASDHRNQ